MLWPAKPITQKSAYVRPYRAARSPAGSDAGSVGFVLLCRIGVDRRQVILAIDLHAVPGEEEQPDIVVWQRSLKSLECPVHVGDRAVEFLDYREAAGFELGRDVFCIVRGVLKFPGIFVCAVADDEGSQTATHSVAARKAACTARTREG